MYKKEKKDQRTHGKDYMSSKLSAVNYIRNNINRVSLISVVFGIFLAMFYSMGMLLESGTDVLRRIFLDQFDRIQVVCLNEVAIENALPQTSINLDMDTKIERIRVGLSRSLNAETLCCNTMHFRINTILGTMGFETAFLVRMGEVKTFLDNYQVELIEGAMPENTNELLIGEADARNMNKKIGDTLFFGKSIKYKIVGIINRLNSLGDKKRSPCYLIVGVKPDSVFPDAIVIFSDSKTTDYTGHEEAIDFYDLLRKNGDTSKLIESGQIEQVIDYTIREKQYAVNYGVNANAISVIRIIFTTAIFMCLIVIFNLYLNDRLSEWCIYNLIGFSSKDVYFLIVRELLIILGFSVLIGVTGYSGFFLVFRKLLFEPYGMTPVFFVGTETFACVSILILFFGILQISVFTSIQRIKTVSVIEDSLL